MCARDSRATCGSDPCLDSVGDLRACSREFDLALGLNGWLVAARVGRSLGGVSFDRGELTGYQVLAKNVGAVVHEMLIGPQPTLVDV